MDEFHGLDLVWEQWKKWLEMQFGYQASCVSWYEDYYFGIFTEKLEEYRMAVWKTAAEHADANEYTVTYDKLEQLYAKSKEWFMAESEQAITNTLRCYPDLNDSFMGDHVETERGPFNLHWETQELNKKDCERIANSLSIKPTEMTTALASFLTYLNENHSLWHKFSMPDGCVTVCHSDMIKDINCDEWQFS